MVDLHERLERLAEDAPRSVPSSDLWQRGRRYRQRKTLAQVLMGLSCLVLVFAAGAMWLDLDPSRPQVGDGQATTWLPDELFVPDPRLRSTTENDGPPGQLIAIVRGEHKSLFSSKFGVFGVSATTGDYRFLDLPDIQEGDGTESYVGLSPDGTKVAYWLGNPEVSGFASGFAIYDAITGELERNPIESRFGLVGEGFGWTKDSVWVQYSKLTKPPTKSGWSANEAPTLIENLVDGTTTNEAIGYLDLSGATSGRAGLVSNSHKGFTVVVSGNPSERTRYRSTIQVNPSPFLSPEGTRVAGLRSSNTSGSGEAVVVGTLPASGNRVVMKQVPGVKAFQIFGWQDDTHVMGIFANKPIVESLDVETGEMTQAVNLSNTWGGSLLATDLLGSPIRPGVEPKAPPNTWSLIAGAAVVAGLGLWIWRRRVRV